MMHHQLVVKVIAFNPTEGTDYSHIEGHLAEFKKVKPLSKRGDDVSSEDTMNLQ